MSYNGNGTSVIKPIIIKHMELSKETKREIRQAEKEIAEGKTYTHEQVKKELGINTTKIKSKKDVP